METVLVLTAALVIGAIVWGIAQGVQQAGHIKELADYMIAIDKITRTRDVIGVDGLSGIAVDEGARQVLFVDRRPESLELFHSIVPFSDVISVEVFENGASVERTSRSSQIGGAVVGSIALGGVGALIGGLSGKTVSTHGVREVALQVTVNDISIPMRTVNFFSTPPGQEPNAQLAGNAQRAAREWKALFAVVIRIADECAQQAQSRGSSPAP